MGARESEEGQYCSNLCVLPQSMDSDNRGLNHWLLIAEAQKIAALQVEASGEDACNRNDKPSNPPSLILSTYCHYFHTPLIPSQELISPQNQLLNLICILCLAFSYTFYAPLDPYV